METEETDPFVKVASPAATVPIPVPIVTGALNLIGIVPVAEYPEPTFVTVIAVIVPEAPTVAVNAAETGSLPSTTKASTLLIRTP